MSTIVDEGGEPPTPTATTPSMMSSTTAPSSTAATSPPLSPKNAGGDEPTSAGLIDAADVHKLRLDLKAAVEAQHTAENRASVLEAELGRFKDQFTFAHAAKEALEQQLREEITRREKAEEKVELLRGQVEQARRGVMQLQKQESDRAARRQSVQLEPEESASTTSTAKKRQSLYLGTRRPLSSQGQGAEEPTPTAEKPSTGLRELRLGGAHARGKSINLRAPPLNTDVPPSPNSPRRPSASPISPRHSPPATSPPRTSEEKPPAATPDLASASSASPLAIPPPVRRESSTSQSGATSFVSAASASTSVLESSPQTLPATNEHIEQLKAARVETAALRAQIEALEMKLAEADEAREASEDCLRAFREFLAADPEAGPGTVSLPPLPHEIDDDEPAPEPVQEKKGWGFGGLFRAEQQGSQEGAKTATSRRGSTASTSPSIAVSPPATAEVLTPVFENEREKEDKDKDAMPDKDKDLPKSPPPSAPSTGWLAGWRSASTATAAPPEPEPVEEEPQPQQGANLGRSLTSFFGRRARAASRAAQRAEENKVDPEAEATDGHDAPLASAIAAEAAAESSTFGLQLSRLPPSESEGSLKTLAARADLAATQPDDDVTAPVPPSAPAPVTTASPTSAKSSSDLDPAARVAAAKAKAEALAAERAEKRRHRAERLSPQASAASSPVRVSPVSATASPTADKFTAKKDADEDSALAYLADAPDAPESKPELVVETAPAASASALSPPSATSPSFAFDQPAAPAAGSPLRSPSLPVPAPSSPISDSASITRPRRSSSLSSPISPVLAARGPSPHSRSATPPKDDEEEELADENEDAKQEAEDDADRPVNGAPKRPQRRNASRRGRGGAAKVRGGAAGRGAARGGFV